jgi:27-O-demethylrifamycin SV methyltransferase
VSYEPSIHYNRVTAAWGMLLGEELHYGVFHEGSEDLATATASLTSLMAQAATIEAGVEVLDVGCGTGAPACHLAKQLSARVTGITTSPAGVEAARARAQTEGVGKLTAFEERDGMENGFPDAAFDRIWVLESSHLMRRRDQLMSECARVLRRGGRFALCDIVLKREMPFTEVRRLRKPLALLREVFGDARMEPVDEYRRLATASGLAVDTEIDLTAETRPTLARWRDNAEHHREEVATLLGEDERRRFVEACSVLERFWQDGRLGYALLAGSKP